MNKCIKCGTNIAGDKARYCTKCGAAVSEDLPFVTVEYTRDDVINVLKDIGHEVNDENIHKVINGCMNTLQDKKHGIDLIRATAMLVV